MSSLSVDERLTIANMTTEWGALTGLFPIDDVLLQWVRERANFLRHRGPACVPSDPPLEGTDPSLYDHPRVNPRSLKALSQEDLYADPHATYAQTIRLDLSTVEPHVSGPNHVKTMTSVAEMEKKNIKIHKAYIVSCVNSRLSDIEQAASILKGQKVAEGVELYIAPASSEVQVDAEAKGYWNQLIAAGAMPLPAGCGPCIGLGAGLLEDGEVGISATNRNFKGRMGSPNAEAYLASPAVVAASAIQGKISSVASVDGVSYVGCFGGRR